MSLDALVLSKMVVNALISQYLIRPQDVSSDFNLTAWHEQNPNFYVPPHPLLYALNPEQLLFLALTHMLVPKPYSHAVQVGHLMLRSAIDFPYGLWLMPDWISKSIFTLIYIFLRTMDYDSIISLVRTVKVIVTTKNFFYWVLNYFSFGIFATWPLIRPDLYQQYAHEFCMYWSC